MKAENDSLKKKPGGSEQNWAYVNAEASNLVHVVLQQCVAPNLVSTAATIPSHRLADIFV